MVKRIEVLANCAIILLVAFILTVAGYHVWLSRHGIRQQAAGNRTELVGQHLDLPTANFRAANHTLVIVAASYCHFCIASAPFYAKLAADNHMQHATRVVLAMPQDPSTAESFAQRFNIHPNQVIQASLDSLGVNGTPTLLLVDSKGTIVQEWVGQLGRADETQVIHSVND